MAKFEHSDGFKNQLEMGYGPGGLSTFGQFPFVPDVSDLDKYAPHVAVVGVPWDCNTTFRPGARFGPHALRTQAFDQGNYNLDLDIDFTDYLTIFDIGDVDCPHGLQEESFRNIESAIYEVAKRKIIPIIIGGDHSITYPSATAVARSYGFGNVGIVHFDAHADTADTIEGNLVSHGTPMRRLIESGAVKGENFVQVGLRGYWPPPEVFEWMKQQKMRWHLMDEIWERGFKPVMKDAIDEALQGAENLYLSVDIDVLDPGFAPGTGTPEPGGLNPADLLRIVRAIGLNCNVVAMDVVEVAPAYDVSNNTVNNAHRVIFECLSGMAKRKMNLNKAKPD